MKKKLIFVFLFLLLTTHTALAWTGPSQAPPNGMTSTDFFLNTGSTDQVKDGGLWVKGTATTSKLCVGNDSSKPCWPNLPDLSVLPAVGPVATGTGAANTITKWRNTQGGLINSQITDNGLRISLGGLLIATTTGSGSPKVGISAPLSIKPGSTEILTVTSNGVGIKNNNPGATELYVSGNSIISGTATTSKLCFGIVGNDCQTSWPTYTPQAFPFTPRVSFGITANATDTPLFLRAGLHASSTSQIAYASTTALSANSLCLGSNCIASWPTFIPQLFPFVPTTNYNVAVNATSTPLWLSRGLYASSTSQIAYASTTALSANSLCLQTPGPTVLPDCRSIWPVIPDPLAPLTGAGGQTVVFKGGATGASMSATSSLKISDTGNVAIGPLAYSNINATKLFVSSGNIHVYGNDPAHYRSSDVDKEPYLSERSRLRVGNVYGYAGLYAEQAIWPSGTDPADLLLGASSGYVRIGGFDGNTTATTNPTNHPNNLLVDGKVRIGISNITDVPQADLDVVGNARVSGTLTANVFSGSGGSLTGLTATQIPDLSTVKITSGVFLDARIPGLDAAKITSGVFLDALIPALAASKTTSGIFDPARIGTGALSNGRVLTLDSAGSASWVDPAPGVPAGAIMAFDLDTCPTGWTAPFTSANGRFLLGSSASHSRTSTGGAETHTLITPEMPSHTHDVNVYAARRFYNSNDENARVTAYADLTTYTTLPTGGGQPHSIMPPYYTVLYCKKN